LFEEVARHEREPVGAAGTIRTTARRLVLS
jgi:hypothetical protein